MAGARGQGRGARGAHISLTRAHLPPHALLSFVSLTLAASFSKKVHQQCSTFAGEVRVRGRGWG